MSLTEIIEDYTNTVDTSKDNNGKKLYKRIDSELRARGKSRQEIIELIVDYLTKNNESKITPIVNFLKKLL